MADNQTTQTPESLGLIQIGEGVYAKLKSVTAIIDVVDANGNLLQSQGFTQSGNSIVTLQGADLAGLELPVQTVADKIYNLNQAVLEA